MSDDEWNAAYWELVALTRPRAWWWSGWPHWTKPVGIGTDEYWRWTVWVGPLVVAFWTTSEGRERIAELVQQLAEDD